MFFTLFNSIQICTNEQCYASQWGNHSRQMLISGALASPCITLLLDLCPFDRMAGERTKKLCTKLPPRKLLELSPERKHQRMGKSSGTATCPSHVCSALQSSHLSPNYWQVFLNVMLTECGHLKSSSQASRLFLSTVLCLSFTLAPFLYILFIVIPVKSMCFYCIGTSKIKFDNN